jgi:hypothetical protein
VNKTLYLMSFIIFLVGCNSSPTPLFSGVEGQVFLGPTCPVVRVDNPCPDRPYQATLSVLSVDGERIARFQTGADGSFHFALAPGKYTLRPESPSVMPHAPEQPFSILANQYTRLTVTYDSGIR